MLKVRMTVKGILHRTDVLVLPKLKLLRQSQDVHDHHYHMREQMYHSRDRDFGMVAVLVHLLGDAINNVGVIIAGLVIWFASFDGRYYADPGVSMAIALLIFITSIPLSKSPLSFRKHAQAHSNSSSKQCQDSPSKCPP